ncbi:hypothetical protein CCACVL1_30155 [Corchorus capsularis]|uniref:Uncharacterized protein n=1 Tax=Corchorus capsularis TaxID=210143 RepID=A0A1R3FYJ9_COCAP|nr:hypothetical protein CCACVL1_30155 [Corchorus capsularis]
MKARQAAAAGFGGQPGLLFLSFHINLPRVFLSLLSLTCVSLVSLLPTRVSISTAILTPSLLLLGIQQIELFQNSPFQVQTSPPSLTSNYQLTPYPLARIA